MAKKEFTWLGMKEDEITALDLDAFIDLAPSRVRRTLKRGFSDAQKAFLKRLSSGENNIKTHCRDLPVLPSMIGKTIQIYNGKEFKSITITAEMLGHFLGEFSVTRKNVSHSGAGVGATRSSKAVSAR